MEKGTKLEPARKLAVDIPVDKSTSRTDCFIDDLIQVVLDTPDNLERDALAPPLAVHATTRPHAGAEEPVARRNLLGDDKLKAEGRHAELQTVLGWDMDCRSFTVALPPDKYAAWVSDLDDLIGIGRPNDKERA